jgi:trk system potassium uptake protein TrkH
LPFIFAEQPNLTVTDAFFESFSGLTTTGATTLVGLDSLPHAIFLSADAAMVWRHGDHRAGGSDSADTGRRGMQLYRAEMPGR